MSTYKGSVSSYVFTAGGIPTDAVYVGAEKVFPPAPWWYHGRLMPSATSGYGLAFSPDGTKIFSSNNGPKLEVYDVTTRLVLNTTTTPTGSQTWGLVTSPDGKLLYVADWGAKKVITMDTETYALSDLCVLADGPRSIVVHPDGSTVYACGNNFGLWVIDAASGTLVTTIGSGGPSDTKGLAISRDGSTVAMVKVSSNSVDVVDTATNTLRANVPMAHPVGGLDFSADGNSLYVADKNTAAPSAGASVVSLDTNTIVGKVSTEKPINDVIVSPDGRYLYAAHTGNTASLEVVDLAAGVSRATVNIPDDELDTLDTIPTNNFINAFAMSADGRNICVEKTLGIIRADYPGIGTVADPA